MTHGFTVDNLHVQFQTQSQTVHAVNGVSFEIQPGELVGLVGESGCGKSVIARSLVRLEGPGEIVDGTIQFEGRELTTADERTLRRVRGRELSIVFQDPSSTLNPAYTVGEQIAESVRIHRDPDRQPLFRELAAGVSSRLRSRKIRDEVLELMETVGIPRPEDWIDAYPHRFSGGMRQRAMLAVALARRPSLLIADEPTTNLDTTTQATILDRLAELNEEYGLGMLLISHDFDVVSELCDRVLVLYRGTIVERGPTKDVLADPNHPYTKSLLGCLPHRFEPKTRLPTVDGIAPDDTTPPSGCVFADRCPFARKECRDESPPVVSATKEHSAKCGVPDARRSTLEAATDPQPQMAVDGGVYHPSQSNPASTSLEGTLHDTSSKLTGDRSAEDRSIVELDGVTKSFRTSDTLVGRLLGDDDHLPAVRDVSLELNARETIGLVGESGCGKSTLSRVIAGLEEPTDGTVQLHGQSVSGVRSRTTEQLAEVGFVFQNPATSVNFHLTVSEAIAEPLREHGWSRSSREKRVEELLSLVELPVEYATRYPQQLSGGQLQRVTIARALALEPSIVILDEPTSALDVSVQASVLNLLNSLQTELGVAYLFVSHDLSVVRHVADRVAVMYLGHLVEVGPADQVFSTPSHPYTQTLLAAIPGADTEGEFDRVRGDPPSPMTPPSGCSFHPRCPMAEDDCTQVQPTFQSVRAARSRCLYAADCYQETERD